MKKNILVAILFITPISMYCQIGINTENPKTDLDINGNICIRGPLKVGANADPGDVGDILTSGGANVSPRWQAITTTSMGTPGNFILTDVYSLESRNGISFASDEQQSLDKDKFDPSEYMPLASPWKEIPSSEIEFTINKDNSTVLIAFQTSVISGYQVTTGVTSSILAGLYANYIGALFLLQNNSDDIYKLIIGRQGQISGFSTPESVFTLFYALNNLNIGTYKIKPAFIRMDSDARMGTAPLYIGSINNNGFTYFMTKTTLKLDIYTSQN